MSTLQHLCLSESACIHGTVSDNEMQMIFNTILGSSGRVPVTPIGENEMYYALWE